MKSLILSATAVLLLAGCTASSDGSAKLSPNAQAALQVTCALAPLAPGAVAAGSAIAVIAGADADTVAQATKADALAHQLVVNACATVAPGSTPVSVAPATVVAPAAAR